MGIKKIWCLFEDSSYDDSGGGTICSEDVLLGIFETKELAEKALETFKSSRTYQYDSEHSNYIDVHIDEKRLNEYMWLEWEEL